MTGTQFTLAAVLGLLFAVGTFLVLRRDLVRVIWGVIIVSQAANVYLVTMGGLTGSPPVLAHHGTPGEVTDPLVQALVLTAIVIGFGTTAFALVLTYRVYEEHGTIDLQDLARGSESASGTGSGSGSASGTGSGSGSASGTGSGSGSASGTGSGSGSASGTGSGSGSASGSGSGSGSASGSGDSLPGDTGG